MLLPSMMELLVTGNHVGPAFVGVAAFVGDGP